MSADGDVNAGAGSGGAGGERVCELEKKVSELVETLAQAREALDAAERRHRIDLELIQSGTVDLETARLLTEMAVAQMPEQDVALAVRELKKSKGFLFKGAGVVAGNRSVGAMGASARGAGGEGVGDLKNAAAESGDRAALLRYLKARRGR